MSKFSETLQKVKKNPGLYFGEPSIKLLNAFIAGYSMCEIAEDIIQEHNEFEWFNEFVAKKYDIVNTTHGWVHIISFITPTDRDAFYKFYEDFEEFSKLSKKEKEKIISENQDNVRRLLELDN